jgi:hypothetical protein
MNGAIDHNTSHRKERQDAHDAKLEVLRGEIRAGLASGDAAPLDMAEIKAEARAAPRFAKPQSEPKESGEAFAPPPHSFRSASGQ